MSSTLPATDAEGANNARGSPAEALRAFLKTGPTSFGGSIARLGHFCTEFVERRKWLCEKAYSDMPQTDRSIAQPKS